MFSLTLCPVHIMIPITLPAIFDHKAVSVSLDQIIRSFDFSEVTLIPLLVSRYPDAYFVHY